MEVGSFFFFFFGRCGKMKLMENNAVCHEVCRKTLKVKEQRHGLSIAKYLPHWFWVWKLSTTGKGITRGVRLNGPTWSMLLKNSWDARHFRTVVPFLYIAVNTFSKSLNVRHSRCIEIKYITSNRRYHFEHHNYRRKNPCLWLQSWRLND